MIRITAQATTGSDGKRLYGRHGLDLSNIFVDNMGERIDPWQREVTFQYEDTLENVTNPDIPKYAKYDLLAWNLINEEGYGTETVVRMYASGKVREMRVAEASGVKYRVWRIYRMIGNVYYGSWHKYQKQLANEEYREKKRQEKENDLD